MILNMYVIIVICSGFGSLLLITVLLITLIQKDKREKKTSVNKMSHGT